MRVAVVNDMVMAVESLRRVLEASGLHQVAWVASDGAEAVANCARDTPELILMDLIMPVMDGVEATRQIMNQSPCPILVVTSTVDGHAGMVFEAMGAGALDAVNTPVLGVQDDFLNSEGSQGLLAKIATIDKLIRPGQVAKRIFADLSQERLDTKEHPLIVIGSSSGGPQALAKIFSRLAPDFTTPIVVIQHVDAHFADELASWLDSQSPLNIRVARHGDAVESGSVLIAGTNDHLIMDEQQRLVYTPDPEHLVYRPSADVFFESVASYWHGYVVAVLLTGMGRDGAQGLLTLREKGAHTIAQDQSTSAVYGMPKAAAEIRAAVEVLPIDLICNAMVKRVRAPTVTVERGMV